MGISIRAQTQELYINEFLSSNSSTNLDPDFYSFCDWIEIYNSEETAVDISGYYITDDLTNPLKFQFPNYSIIQPKGYFIVWADGENYHPGTYHIYPEDIDLIISDCHTNFKLNKSAEEIGLFSPNGDLIDSITFNKQITNVSYGRNPDATAEWIYFDNPSPLDANASIGYIDATRASTPILLPSGGFYKISQNIEMIAHPQSSKIYYTIDGTKPTINSNLYTKPIAIDSTTVIRAKSFQSELLPSAITTHTYFIDEEFSLPVISIAVEPDYLWDDKIGIYVGGTNGTILHGDWGSRANLGVKNYFQNWERPASVEFYKINGELILSNQVGLKTHGGTNGRSTPQKSLTFHARKKYGNEYINWQIFKDKPIGVYKTLLLRNSGSDWLHKHSSTMFRDALMQSLMPVEVDIDRQSNLQLIVFINGEYWGIHNLRERVNSHYVESNYGIEEDNVDMLGVKYGYFYTFEGDVDEYNQLIKFIRSNDITNQNTYNYIKTKVDIDELINYIILQIYIANFDWPQNNLKLWKPKSTDGKWRWILNDTDDGFWRHIYTPSDGNARNILQWVEKINNQNHNDNRNGGLAVFSELIENKSFRDEFIQRSAAHMNSALSPRKISSLIDGFSASVIQEIPRHLFRWENLCNDDGLYCSVISSVEQWEENILSLKQFASERPAILRQNIIDYFTLNGIAKLTVGISDSSAGKILVHDMNIQSFPDTGHYFKEIPIRITAVPNEGYQFVNWFGKSGFQISGFDSLAPITSISSDTISLILTDNDSGGVAHVKSGEQAALTAGGTLISNGGFDSNVAGWRAGGNSGSGKGAFALQSSCETGNGARLSGASGGTMYARWHSSGLVVGKRYYFTCWHKDGSGTGSIRAASTMSGSDLIPHTTLSSAEGAYFNYVFEATSSHCYVWFANSNWNTYFDFDTVGLFQQHKWITEPAPVNTGEQPVNQFTYDAKSDSAITAVFQAIDYMPIIIDKIINVPFSFSFAAEKGKTYVVEVTDNLKQWRKLKTYNGAGTLVRFEDERDQVFPHVYYRVKVDE